MDDGKPLDACVLFALWEGQRTKTMDNTCKKGVELVLEMASNHSLIPRGAPSGPQTSPKTLQTTIWESKSSPLHLLCDQQTCGNLMDSLSHGCGHGGGYAAALGITLKLDTQ